MWQSIVSAFLQGIASMFVTDYQHQQNISDWERQNNYNEQMYNKYNSPEARAEQLRRAGTSDAAIGAALTGFNGSGTQITSSPLQPTNVADVFGQMFNAFNQTKITDSESMLNRSNIKINEIELTKRGYEAGLKGYELRLYKATFKKMVQHATLENDLLATEIGLKQNESWLASVNSMLKDQEYRINEKTFDAQCQDYYNKIRLQESKLNLNEQEVKTLAANMAYLYAQAESITQLEDVRKREAAEAKFYKKFLDKFGIPYDMAKDVADLGEKILNGIFDMFGFKWIFKK